jgi:hypothetical protein
VSLGEPLGEGSPWSRDEPNVMPDSVPTVDIQPVIGAIAFELSPIRHWSKKEIPLLQHSVPVYSKQKPWVRPIGQHTSYTAG